ncbi:uncharacterized protein DNG_10274 [Cephalotrichum gorgonifer]|uniref:Rhodopsin domain-containing protein n=1 Tax=Cephalotrichum gorgonifer TaxID=2041049 RepID=A0AAE8N8K3_9PEZI|nr:uncharacterized protein DNG_10274 [Cephalotrichum gorgonifer]
MDQLTPEQFAALPHDNAGPRLKATSWTLVSLATAFAAIRVYCKLSARHGLWWDDYMIIASWVVLFGLAVVTDQLVRFGYGVHVWDLPPQGTGNSDVVLPLLLSRGVLSSVALAWTKTSFALSLLRVTSGWTKRAVWIIAVSTNIAMGSCAIVFMACSPVQAAWDLSVAGKCVPPDVKRGVLIFAGSYSAAMDLTLAMIPWKVIWNLQMRRKEKIGAGIAMSLGVFAGITGIVKTTLIPTLFSFDISYDPVDLFIWDMAEGAVTIVATCIPVLRVLLPVSLSKGGSYGVSHKRSGATRSSERKLPKSTNSDRSFTGSGIMKEVEFEIDEYEVDNKQKAGDGAEKKEVEGF